jgi:alpha-ketoglutarate-dependent taurine dioxygenase
VGGDTTVIEVDTLVRAILEAGLSAAVELLTDACFPTVNVPRKQGNEVVLTAILERHPSGHFYARFRGEQLLEAVKLVPCALDEQDMAAMQQFIDMAWNPRYALPVHLQPGDVLGFTNGRLLPGRTAIQADARRDLKRATTV